ncbi:MAG: low specificity L-threonine aldolase [Steroidobacteraceae bacterium]
MTEAPTAAGATRRNFASDNVVPAAPEIMAALAAANRGAVHAYGDDPVTAELQRLAEEVFEHELAIYPVATGTAANSLALACLTPPFGAVYCHEAAHINTDECGAPEFFTGGAKLVGLPSPNGKLHPGQLSAPLTHARDMGVHHVRPAVLSLTQATEWGTVYSIMELAALGEAARANGLALHMDGARFANAVVHLETTPAALSWQSGVQLLSLGATKNGALAAEAVICFDPALRAEFERRRKRSGHLWSKLRFLSAQLLAYLQDGLWLRHAAQANTMAQRLAFGLDDLSLRLEQKVQANEVFVRLPQFIIDGLFAQGFEFYLWPRADEDDPVPLARLVCTYDMQPRDVDVLLGAIQRLLKQSRARQ